MLFMVRFRFRELGDLLIGNPQHKEFIQEADHDHAFFRAKRQLGVKAQVPGVHALQAHPRAEAFDQIEDQEEQGQQEKEPPDHLQPGKPQVRCGRGGERPVIQAA
jgi:hypothetical protein